MPYIYKNGVPYGQTAVYGGFTPVGTVISIMSNSAPANYLKCDGTTYNISDYPELANHFKSEFGSANYFGGDGTTTFKVPDLRGEFLRGTGTNSHTNQGNGANVGNHQDATEIPYFGFNQDAGDLWTQTTAGKNLGVSLGVIKEDHLNTTTVKTGEYWRRTNTFSDASGSTTFTAKPTNTSVLYCIAYKDIYIENEPTVDYSLGERRIGTWIDGKPLYRNILHTGPFYIDKSSTNPSWQKLVEAPANSNIESLADAKFININGSVYRTYQPFAFNYDTIDAGWIDVINPRDNVLSANDAILYIEYTKTTD